MTLALTVAALLACIVITLVTCIQLFYLESLRIHTRERKSLEFFKTTLEAKLGLETERGALTFSVVKHLGLGIIGCLMLAVAAQDSPTWEQLAVACLLVAAYIVVGTFIVPQIVYRKSTGRGLLPLVPLFRALAWAVRPLVWALAFSQSLFELDDAPKSDEAQRPEEHIEALINAGEEEGIIEKEDRALIQSVVAFGDKTVRELMTPRPRVVAIRQERDA